MLLIAAHRLEPADNAMFLVYWGVLFGGFGVVTGISPEAARAAHDAALNLRAGAGSPIGGKPRRAGRIATVAIAYGAVFAALITLSGFSWGRFVLPGHESLIGVAALSCFAYTGHLALWGILTGLRRWRAMAALQAGEATTRMVAVLIALVLSGQLTALAVGSAVSSAAWLATLVLPSARAHLRRRADVSASQLIGNDLRASGGTAASAALTVGFPVLIALTSNRQELLGAAGLLLAISLSRAPLLVPLTAFQGVALSYFMVHRGRGLRALLPILAAIAAVTAAAALAGWLIGPWFFQLLLGHRYYVNGGTLAGLIVAAGLLTVLTIAGMCCVALRAHSVFLAGWVVAVLVAVGVLFVPADLSVRVVLALGLGPLVGVGLQLVGLSRLSRRHPDREGLTN